MSPGMVEWVTLELSPPWWPTILQAARETGGTWGTRSGERVLGKVGDRTAWLRANHERGKQRDTQGGGSLQTQWHKLACAWLLWGQNVCHMACACTGSFLQTLAVRLGLCYNLLSLFTTYMRSHTNIFSISASSLLAKVLSTSAREALTPPTVLSKALLGITASECGAQPQLCPQEDPQAPFLWAFVHLCVYTAYRQSLCWQESKSSKSGPHMFYPLPS